MLVHGVGLDRTVWDRQVTDLKEHYHIVTYDLPGHGEASPPSNDAVLDSYVEDLEHVLMQAGVTHAVLVGAAFGSFVVQRFAQLHPARVDGLCLVSPLYRRTDAQRQAVLDRVEMTDRDGVGATLDASIERWLSSAFRGQQPGAVDALRALILRTNHHGFMSAYRVFATCDGAVADDSATLRCPIQIITGAGDGNASPGAAWALAEAVGQDDVVVLPGVRHLVSIEAADVLTEHIKAFMVRCEAESTMRAKHTR